MGSPPIARVSSVGDLSGLKGAAIVGVVARYVIPIRFNASRSLKRRKSFDLRQRVAPLDRVLKILTTETSNIQGASYRSLLLTERR